MRERFLAKVHKTKSCWLWMASRKDNGYGQFGIKARQIIGAHRVSWMIHRGEIPTGLQVCHRCDVKHCVNPEHLFLGTQKDNIQDALDKGRHFTPFKPKKKCKRGHDWGASYPRCLTCVNIARDLLRRKLGVPERRKRNQ